MKTTMTIIGKNDTRCPVCFAEFNLHDILAAGYKNCPHCKTTTPPLKMSEDGYVHLNWQDIRVLAIYAQRWAGTFDTNNKGNLDAIVALSNIVRKLGRFRPKDGESLDPLIKTPGIPEAIDKAKKLVPSPYYKKSPPRQ